MNYNEIEKELSKTKVQTWRLSVYIDIMRKISTTFSGLSDEEKVFILDSLKNIINNIVNGG